MQLAGRNVSNLCPFCAAGCPLARRTCISSLDSAGHGKTAPLRCAQGMAAQERRPLHCDGGTMPVTSFCWASGFAGLETGSRPTFRDGQVESKRLSSIVGSLRLFL